MEAHANSSRLSFFFLSGIVFFEAIEKYGGWLGNTEFLEGRESQNGVLSERNELRQLFIMP